MYHMCGRCVLVRVCSRACVGIYFLCVCVCVFVSARARECLFVCGGRGMYVCE